MDILSYMTSIFGNKKLIKICGQSYHLIRLLQSGGYALVFEIEDIITHIHYALKISKIEYFIYSKNEISMMKLLELKFNIVKIINYEITDKNVYIIMELCGLDFFDYTYGLRISNSEIRRNYFRQLCKCMLSIHDLGIIHRDIKRENFLTYFPEKCNCDTKYNIDDPIDMITSHAFNLFNNIVSKFIDISCTKCNNYCYCHRSTINNLDEEVQLKLADFGCTILLTQPVEDGKFEEIECSESVGTDFYLSPESSQKNSFGLYKWSQKCDIWALGIILFEITYGYRPFSVSSKKKVLLFPNKDEKIENEVIKWCLEYDASKRPSIHELLEHPYLLPTPPTIGQGRIEDVFTISEELDRKLTPSQHITIRSEVLKLDGPENISAPHLVQASVVKCTPSPYACRKVKPQVAQINLSPVLEENMCPNKMSLSDVSEMNTSTPVKSVKFKGLRISN